MAQDGSNRSSQSHRCVTDAIVLSHFREIRGMPPPHGKEEQPGNMRNMIHIENKVRFHLGRRHSDREMESRVDTSAASVSWCLQHG